MPNPRIIYKFLELLLVFSFFFTPLLFFTASHDQFELPKLTFLVVLVIPFVLIQFRENTSRPMTPLNYALLFFFGTQVAASLPQTSLSWRASLLGDYENFSGLTTLATYGLWFWVFSGVLNETRMEKIIFFNTLAALLSSLYAFGQHFGFDFIPWNPESVNSTREFASMGNPNFLSAYLAMSVPLFLTFFLKSQFVSEKEPGAFETKPWVLASTGLLIMGFGLFCTASRGGFLGALAGFGLWLLLLLGQKERRNKCLQKFSEIPGSFLYVFSFGIVISLFSLFSFGHSFLDRLWVSLTHAGESLAVSRLHIWRPALEFIKANPVSGTGLDTFKIAFPFYSGIEFNLIDGMFMSSRMAHNEILQITATSGLLGLISYLGVLMAFIGMWWKSFRYAGPSGQWVLIGILSSALAYHIQNLFSFGVAALNFLWFFQLAVVQTFYRKANPAPQTQVLPGPPAEIVKKTFIVLSVGSILFFYLPRLDADIAFSRGNTISQFLKKPDPQMAPSGILYYSDYGIERLKKSTALCPLEAKYQLYLGLAYEQRAQLDKEHSQKWLLEALCGYQKATQMSPGNAYYYNDQGRIYTSLGSEEPRYLVPAEEAYKYAVLWAPSSPFFVINWAMAMEKNGKKTEAEEQLRRAFTLSPTFTSKVLSQMAFEAYQKGDKEKALQRIDEAIRGNTSSAEAYFARGIMNLSEKKKKKALEDFTAVKNLHPTPEKNPSIQSLDQFIEQAKN